MNTLLYALVSALRCHRWLRMLACAFLFTSLGNGLTQVLVFGLLLDWQAPASLLTLAYLFATLPGFLGSLVGEKLCHSFSPITLLVATECLGLAALLFPLLGIHFHSITALLAVHSTEAFLSGMSWPALTLLFKRGLSEAELPAATCLENIIFASQVLAGTGLGIVLFHSLPAMTLVGIDALTFAGSLLMLMLAGRSLPSLAPYHAAETARPVAMRWLTLTPQQKRSLLLLPALAAVGSPAMALLPALAQQIEPEDAAGLALPLLFARSLGQLCGPLLLKRDSLPHFASQNRLLLLCLGLFLIAYGVIPLLSGVQILGVVFLAHLASNIVFAAGTFSVLSSFQATEVSSASGKAWRWQTVSASLFTCIAALVAASLGPMQALYSVSTGALLMVAGIMLRYRQ
ncbi:MFS transporter [Silvania hatchlandensis]|uniref:MFS transporter n=1 Tax=Silvania hatchlandensis TaxID=2926469 RepID=A0A9J6Q0V9_9ENTR|nr:MFS transporter [Silvania hatchlandensis]MCU6662882.1 MFS transporter [Silvania hatchlandensis]